ncbi:MAG: CDP-glucose 4,6-dehydratase [Proteobacteria bacterium]|nr:CDP-glucose 4,6-dehydratase [Pseudomonadota bacterium]
MADGFWADRRVLVTGHTGFIGSWMCLWLHRLGAKVSGIAIDPPSQPNLFEVARVSDLVADERCDIRDFAGMVNAVRRLRPEIVFHLAAQSLVRPGYAAPVETFATNIMGTVHVLDALRSTPGVAAAVVVTSDKCYANDDSGRAMTESDLLGGYDPYSSSKAGAEIVAASYRDSYLREKGVPLATVRAGNVIGGGDWAVDRLLPDIVRAFSAGKAVMIRHPLSTRPWQHVLEPVSGCMLLAKALVSRGDEFAEAWNLGPDASHSKTVSHIAGLAARLWGQGASIEADVQNDVHEAHLLGLDASKARRRLDWTPVWDVDRAVAESLNWYRAHLGGDDMQRYSLAQIAAFTAGNPHG